MSRRASVSRVDKTLNQLYAKLGNASAYVKTTPKKSIITDGLAWVIFLLIVGIPIVCLIITPFLFHKYYPDLF